MTTGTKSIYDKYGNRVYYKDWSGGNGKYDANGNMKINNYSCTVLRSTHINSPYTPFYQTPIYAPRNCFDSSSDARLLSKLVDNVRGHSFNAGVALAESRQTVNLAASAAVRIGRALLLLRRGDLPSCMRALGSGVRKGHRLPKKLKGTDVSSAWLEARYGWEPLLSDVIEVSKAWEHAYNTKKVDWVRAKHRVNGVPVDNGTYTQTEPPVSSTRKATFYSVKTISCRLTSTDTSLRLMGLLDPASVAWELLPFSFVADWFIPIGNYIELCSQVPNIRTDYFVISRGDHVQENATYASCIWSGPPPMHCGARIFCSCNNKGMFYTRVTSTTLVVPKPQFKPLKAALSVAHLQNATALLHQIVSNVVR